MIKKINRKNILITFFAFLLIILLSVSYIPFSSFADENETAEQDQNSQTEIQRDNLIVQAYNRKDSLISLENPIDYSGGKAYTINWTDLKEFSIYYSPDESNPPPIKYEEGKEELPENIIYTMNISISYLQGYTDEGNFNVSDTITLENVYTITQHGENSYKNLITNKYKLNIDTGERGIDKTTQEVVTIKEWGIYRFTLDVNGSEVVSDFFVVQPDLLISEQPKINYSIVSSDNSMHDSFNFYLENADIYKYIDKSALVWYVKGEGKDGTKYALTSSEVGKGNFTDCTASIYESIDRTGTTFYFNDNEISGKWQVWCEYQSHGTESPVQSNLIIEVETGLTIDGMVVVYIIIGAVILSILIVTIIAVVRKKKEKVW